MERGKPITDKDPEVHQERDTVGKKGDGNGKEGKADSVGEAQEIVTNLTYGQYFVPQGKRFDYCMGEGMVNCGYSPAMSISNIQKMLSKFNQQQMEKKDEAGVQFLKPNTIKEMEERNGNS